MKKWIYIIGAFLIVLSVAGYYYKAYQSEKDRADRWKNNHDEMTGKFEQTKDELGRNQSRVKMLRITMSEMQSKLYESDSLISEFKAEAEASDIEIKRLKSMLKAEIQSKNEGQTVIRDTVIIDNTNDLIRIDDGYLHLNAWWNNQDSVNWAYQYNERIYYLESVKRKQYNEKGNKRFFLWRWIWPNWQSEITIKSTNPNSEIKAKKVDIVE